MLIFNCVTCQQRIRPANFVTDSGDDEAVMCDICEEYAVHIRCMSELDVEYMELEGDWLCRECHVRVQEIEDEYEAQQEEIHRDMHRMLGLPPPQPARNVPGVVVQQRNSDLIEVRIRPPADFDDRLLPELLRDIRRMLQLQPIALQRQNAFMPNPPQFVPP